MNIVQWRTSLFWKVQQHSYKNDEGVQKICYSKKVKQLTLNTFGSIEKKNREKRKLIFHQDDAPAQWSILTMATLNE